jgi:ferritin-like metal-binding protein YciE
MIPGLSLTELKVIGVLVLVVALLTGFFLFQRHEQELGAAACKAAAADAQAAEHQKTLAESARNNDLAAQLEQARAERKTTYATITKTVDRIVDRPVYRAECIDADGVRSINAALAGKAADPGQPDAAMPAASAASGTDGG